MIMNDAAKALVADPRFRRPSTISAQTFRPWRRSSGPAMMRRSSLTGPDLRQKDRGVPAFPFPKSTSGMRHRPDLLHSGNTGLAQGVMLTIVLKNVTVHALGTIAEL
jgi:hypothetical protein